MSVVLSGMAYYIFKFVQAPVFQTWGIGGVSAVICFFALYLVADFDISSKERADRMKVFGSLSLTIIFLVFSGTLCSLCIIESSISGESFIYTFVFSSLVYGVCLYLENTIFSMR